MNEKIERHSINRWWKKRAAWAAIGLVAWFGSAEAKQHVSEPKDVSNNVWGALDTTEWAGQGLVGINGALLIFGGLAVELSYANRRKDQEKLSKLKDSLPRFEIKSRDQAVLNMEAATTKYGGDPTSLRTLKRLLLNPHSEELDFYEEVEHTADDLAEKFHTGLSDTSGTVRQEAITRVIQESSILDCGLPISLDCPVTPWTEDAEASGHKFWYEYILKREQELYPDTIDIAV